MVYVSMNNFAGCIEGATVNTGASDLKFRKTAGQRSNTGATVWWTPWSGGLQGLFASTELKSVPHWSRNHGNPCAEEGMHARSQQLYFGGGETRHENAEASKAWGPMKLRHPASNLFMKPLLIVLLLPLLGMMT